MNSILRSGDLVMAKCQGAKLRHRCIGEARLSVVADLPPLVLFRDSTRRSVSSCAHYTRDNPESFPINLLGTVREVEVFVQRVEDGDGEL